MGSENQTHRKGDFMKLLTYKKDLLSQPNLGIISTDEHKIFPLHQFNMEYSDMTDFIANVSATDLQLLKEQCKAADLLYDQTDSVIKMAPIPYPKQDIICLGINYLAHAEESARYKKEAFGGERPYAVYFSKRVNKAVGDGNPIPSYPDLVDSLDYEAELAVIIGKEAKNVAREYAENYIFGYTIINDISARNLQTRHKQWYFGKSLDGFTPMGPYIVTADEISFPPSLSIRSRVNGELRQNSSTDLLIFDITHVISELSQGMTLKPGTIISMGTPAGVGMGFQPPKFLHSGDVVECEIEGIGILSNIIR